MRSADMQNHFIFLCVITGIQNTVAGCRLNGRTICHRKAHRDDGEKLEQILQLAVRHI